MFSSTEATIIYRNIFPLSKIYDFCNPMNRLVFACAFTYNSTRAKDTQPVLYCLSAYSGCRRNKPSHSRSHLLRLLWRKICHHWAMPERLMQEKIFPWIQIRRLLPQHLMSRTRKLTVA